MRRVGGPWGRQGGSVSVALMRETEGRVRRERSPADCGGCAPEEEVVRVWREAAVLKEPQQVVELSVDVADDLDRGLQLEQRWLVDEDLGGLLNQVSDLVAAEVDLATRLLWERWGERRSSSCRHSLRPSVEGGACARIKFQQGWLALSRADRSFVIRPSIFSDMGACAREAGLTLVRRLQSAPTPPGTTCPQQGTRCISTGGARFGARGCP